MLVRVLITTVTALLLITAPVAAKPPAETAFDAWLDAFNRNDRAALVEFNAQWFGEPEHNIVYLLDSREETGGLDVIRVERSEPMELVALTQERSFPVEPANGARFTSWLGLAPQSQAHMECGQAGSDAHTCVDRGSDFSASHGISHGQTTCRGGFRRMAGCVQPQ